MLSTCQNEILGPFVHSYGWLCWLEEASLQLIINRLLPSGSTAGRSEACKHARPEGLLWMAVQGTSSKKSMSGTYSGCVKPFEKNWQVEREKILLLEGRLFLILTTTKKESRFFIVTNKMYCFILQAKLICFLLSIFNQFLCAWWSAMRLIHLNNWKCCREILMWLLLYSRGFQRTSSAVLWKLLIMPHDRGKLILTDLLFGLGGNLSNSL